ncbi:M23 family metallopeptidase [Thermoflavimicrobium dichotomicum]|uniref:Murein DD-endopeptidase MepM and murein hydrolase activator NlpD, contain LysM domain n=1 Tax=Thermoflavimicrobium dichotomicum TaxID=46223 RepID=A0A1I3K3T6_9BACL|nr:M23 family metallopeptidase [Thermoflavimicrobium dichotomicum]SFI67179.1 Murein DD-endopeptidase MepM and murein hydrolase activator NlpD, contain LysM domain [Thermoflavimicrobium dichotomicum]
MSHKKLIASSLTICSASAAWAMGTTNSHPVYSEELQKPITPFGKELIAQEALVQYLSPITAMADGNLAARVETKPLAYEVKQGDTLYQIAQFFGVDYHDLAKYNHLTDTQRLQTGQKLNIPILRKWIRVRMGETLESLAEKYQITKELILHLNPELQKSKQAYVGQWIAVPQLIDPAKSHKPNGRANQGKAKILPMQEKREAVAVVKQESEKQSSYVFQWPVDGQITSNFGWRNGRQHKGIDIWNAARSKTPIHSSLGGVVVRAGYAGSYGNLVVVDHGGGWVTYYAHLSRIHVHKGQKVDTGQLLGMMGSTGDSTGYHLHFEVRKNGQAINPLSVLR